MENSDNRDKNQTKKSLQPVIKFFSYSQKTNNKAIFSFSDLNQEINQNEPPGYFSHNRTKSSQHLGLEERSEYFLKNRQENTKNEVIINNDYNDFDDFHSHKKLIKSKLMEMIMKNIEDSPKLTLNNGSFPLNKIKKHSNNEYNYVNNIFQKNNSFLQKSYISTSSKKRPGFDDSSMITSPGIDEKLQFGNKMSMENIELLINDEFNSVEKRKIEKFDAKYTFENNTNNISNINNKYENSFPLSNRKTYGKNDYSHVQINSFLDSNNKESFLSFLEQPSQNNLKSEKNSDFFNENRIEALKMERKDSSKKENKGEYDSFREKSANELKDIKQQMQSLECNLNNILEKLNQQIVNSKAALSQSQNLLEENNASSETNSQNINKISANDNSNKKSLVEKKIIVVQKRKNSLKPCESPFKARVDPKTHGLSRNLSTFCKGLLEETISAEKKEGRKHSNTFQREDFSVLNQFRNYEERYLKSSQNTQNNNPLVERKRTESSEFDAQTHNKKPFFAKNDNSDNFYKKYSNLNN